MIFVTVGQMLGFDRFIRAMDDWANRHPEEEVIAQIGDGVYKPAAMNWVAMLSSNEFKATVSRAEIMVAHAGMGSFFVSMETGKPVVMIARQAALSEHTTDHQVHTLHWLRDKPGVFAADAVENLDDAIDAARAMRAIPSQFPRFAPDLFAGRIRQAILK